MQTIVGRKLYNDDDHRQTRTTEAYCPDCEEEKTYREQEWDDLTGQLRIKCVDCGYEHKFQMGSNSEVVEILKPYYGTVDYFYSIISKFKEQKVYGRLLNEFLDVNLETILKESKDTNISQERIKNMIVALMKALF